MCFVIALIIACVCTALHAQQLLPTEVTALEAAWASGQRLTNATVSVTRGFDPPPPTKGGATVATPVENIPTDATGIARTSTKHWERIVVHLPRVVAADHMMCLMVNGKCAALPVGASIDKKNSILYWHVPNAYHGDFDFAFLQPGSRAGAVRVTAGTDSKTGGLR